MFTVEMNSPFSISLGKGGRTLTTTLKFSFMVSCKERRDCEWYGFFEITESFVEGFALLRNLYGEALQ